LGVVKVTINGAAFTDLREVLRADRHSEVAGAAVGNRWGYAGLEVGGQKTSVNAQNRPGLDHRGKNETAAHPPRARSKRSAVRLPLAA
jgi:hypothetical protein